MRHFGVSKRPWIGPLVVFIFYGLLDAFLRILVVEERGKNEEKYMCVMMDDVRYVDSVAVTSAVFGIFEWEKNIGEGRESSIDMLTTFI